MHSLHGNAYESHYIYIKSTCVANSMLPPSIHFEISIPLDAYNFGANRAPLTPWGGGGCTKFYFFTFLIDYRSTYLDINCK